MKKMTTALFLGLTAMVFTWTSCDKSEDLSQKKEKEEQHVISKHADILLQAEQMTNYDKWVYIDLESGKLLTVGADKAGNTYTKHPITGTDIIGFTIPYWEEAKKMCLDAAQKVPQMRFVAWDVAITPNGPTFIEGNSFPSHAVPQFAAHYPDGIGILPEFRKFIDV